MCLERKEMHQVTIIELRSVLPWFCLATRKKRNILVVEVHYQMTCNMCMGRLQLLSLSNDTLKMTSFLRSYVITRHVVRVFILLEIALILFHVYYMSVCVCVYCKHMILTMNIVNSIVSGF